MKHRRVVLDTNVLASALMTPSGNPAKVSCAHNPSSFVSTSAQPTVASGWWLVDEGNVTTPNNLFFIAVAGM